MGPRKEAGWTVEKPCVVEGGSDWEVQAVGDSRACDAGASWPKHTNGSSPGTQPQVCRLISLYTHGRNRPRSQAAGSSVHGEDAHGAAQSTVLCAQAQHAARVQFGRPLIQNAQGERLRTERCDRMKGQGIWMLLSGSTRRHRTRKEEGARESLRGRDDTMTGRGVTAGRGWACHP